jgi:hypothetical protein
MKGGIFSLSKLFSKSKHIAKHIAPTGINQNKFKKELNFIRNKKIENDLNIIKNIHDNMETFNFTDIYSQKMMAPPSLTYAYDITNGIIYIEILIKNLVLKEVGTSNLIISDIRQHITSIEAFNEYIRDINDSSKQEILNILYYIKIIKVVLYFKGILDEFAIDNNTITYYNIYSMNDDDYTFIHDNIYRYRIYIDNYIYYIKYILFTDYNQTQYKDNITINPLHIDYINAKNDCGICTEDQNIHQCNPKSKHCDDFCKYPTVSNNKYKECTSYNTNKPLLTDPSDITTHFIRYLHTYYTKDIFNEFAGIVIQYIIGFCEYIDKEHMNKNEFENKYLLTIGYKKRESIINLLENYKKEIKQIMDKYNVIYDNNTNTFISTNHDENRTLTSILKILKDIYMITDRVKQKNVLDLSKNDKQLSKLLLKLSEIRSLLILSSKPVKSPRSQKNFSTLQ